MEREREKRKIEMKKRPQAIQRGGRVKIVIPFESNVMFMLKERG